MKASLWFHIHNHAYLLLKKLSIFFWKVKESLLSMGGGLKCKHGEFQPLYLTEHCYSSNTTLYHPGYVTSFVNAPIISTCMNFKVTYVGIKHPGRCQHKKFEAPCSRFIVWCILTSKQVLHTLFADWNNLFGKFDIYSIKIKEKR